MAISAVIGRGYGFGSPSFILSRGFGAWTAPVAKVLDIVTRGFGTFGAVGDVITRGYISGTGPITSALDSWYIQCRRRGRK